MKKQILIMILSLSLCFFYTWTAIAKEGVITLADPAGDDDGPGTYTYPTDGVYKKGAFDILEIKIKPKKKTVEFAITVGATIENPWDMASGFSIQMVQIYIDQDKKEGSGFKKTFPGMNAEFAETARWEKAILISPQLASRLNSEISMKVDEAQQKAIIIPQYVRAMGKTITAAVKRADLGGFERTWGFQALMASNEGFPDSSEILSRKVNEYEGLHRFGGGSDYSGDPHFIDCLVSPAKGEKDEIEKQHELLKNYVSKYEEKENVYVQLPMVYAE